MSVFKSDKSEKEINSFDIIVESYKNKLYRIAYAILNDEQRAMDAVQETFIIVWDKLNQLKDVSKFNSWICTIVVNKAKDYYRKNKQETPIIDDDNRIKEVRNEEIYVDLPEQILEKKELREYLLEEISMLSSQYSEAIYLYYYAGLNYEEIAGNLNISINTVASRIYRAKKQLKEKLEQGNYFNDIENMSGDKNE